MKDCAHYLPACEDCLGKEDCRVYLNYVNRYWIITDNNWHIYKVFSTEQGAKVSLTRKYSKKFKGLVIMDSVDFYENMPLVDTVNLMSGEPLKIRACEKGGPTDPGTESYWSN